MAIESMDIDEAMKLLKGVEGIEGEDNSYFFRPRNRDTVEIETDYVPSAIKYMIEEGKSEEEIRAFSETIKKRKIVLMADGHDEIPNDIYEEVFGRR